MVCIYCGNETRVTNSREQKRLRHVWRRRTCKNCSAIFTSIELADLSNSIVVRGLDHKLEKFSRDKLFMSIVASLGHRSDAVTAAGYLCATIVAQLLKSSTEAIFNAPDIINQTKITLGRFDPVAATFYSAYHQTNLPK